MGLDTDPALMPAGTGIFEFNKAIIDATADLVCAYKPNIAFYEALGNAGLEALKRTRDYIGERYSGYHRCQARRYRQYGQRLCPQPFRLL